MIGNDIIFDNINNKIGIAEADCNQRDFSNNGQENEEIPYYNEQINIFKDKKGYYNNYKKNLFLIHS